MKGVNRGGGGDASPVLMEGVWLVQIYPHALVNQLWYFEIILYALFETPLILYTIFRKYTTNVRIEFTSLPLGQLTYIIDIQYT